MKYQIFIDKPALKFLGKQQPAQQKRLLQAINALPNNGDIKPLYGYNNLYRLRVGSYRIIYQLEKEQLIVQVMNIGNRGDVYK